LNTSSQVITVERPWAMLASGVSVAGRPVRSSSSVILSAPSTRTLSELFFCSLVGTFESPWAMLASGVSAVGRSVRRASGRILSEPSTQTLSSFTPSHLPHRIQQHADTLLSLFATGLRPDPGALPIISSAWSPTGSPVHPVSPPHRAPFPCPLGHRWSSTCSTPRPFPSPCWRPFPRMAAASATKPCRTSSRRSSPG